MSKKAVFSIVATAGYLLLSFLASSCDPSKSGEPIFDRKAMLQNYADNFIKPAYIQLQNQTNVLHSAVLVFNTNPTAQTLADLQSIWASAYADWQYANAYNFGPAGESGLRKGLVEEVGTFPASKIKIETSIALAQWNVEDFNRDARGFLAIEYLIFGQGQSADDVLALFDANTWAWVAC